MVFLTDFADLAVILPLTVLVGAALATIGWRREALAWGLAVGGTLAAVLLLKMLAFAQPDPLLTGWSLGGGLGSPSGHTAAGTVVYAGLLTLAGRGGACRRSIAWLAGCMLAMAFGVTRLVVGNHSLADVLVGAALGLGGVTLFARLAGARPNATSGHSLVLPAAATLISLLTFHGQRLPAEQALRTLAAQLWPGGAL
jgi:membrane-associated phospholipid phosphatase